MNFTIDFGNTLTKVGVFDNEELIEIARFDSKKNDFEKFQNIFQKYKVDHVCYLSVIEFSEEINNFFASMNKVTCFDHTIELPFKTLYEPKNQLGLDRLAGVIGANALFPEQDFLVIQAGTCITYDVYEKNTGHLGGAISPGLNIRNQALNTFTHQLPKIEIDNMYHPLIGKNTAEALNSGIFNCTLFEIESYITEISKKYENIITILSGGDIIYFAEKIKSKIFANPNITLIGLNKILTLNA